MADDVPASFKLGDWLVEPGLNRLSRDSNSVLVEPKTMGVLVCLWQHQGKVVSSDEIIAEVWGGRPMGDNPVYKSIAKLRQALGDGTDSPRYIATVSKKGYRLLPVETASRTGIQSDAFSKARRSIMRQSMPIAIGVTIGAVLAAYLFWHPQSPPANLKAVSTFSGSHSQPSLAPDAEKIAFINRVDGTPHIWILDPTQPDPHQLTVGESADARPRWSPDGESILFARNNSLWRVPVSGGQPTEIVRNGYNPNWSHDGSRIVFERRYQVWTANADGSQQRRVAGLPRRELLLTPRWPAFSPDGKKIVYFDSDESPLGDLWTIDLLGGTPEQLTFAPAFGGAPVWSADGKTIIYSSQRGGSRTLWQVDVATRSSHALLTGSGDDDYPDISSDGARIIYSNSREDFSLVITDPDSGEHEDLYQSRQLLVAPDLSFDRTNIAFFGTAHIGGMQIYTMSLSDRTPKMITLDPLAMHAMPRWSADGETLYFYDVSSHSNYSKIAATGGIAQQIVADWDWNVANGASVHPDEKSIIYSRLTGQTPVQTSILNLETKAIESFFATLEYPRWSEDGQRVIGSRSTDQQFPGDVVVCQLAEDNCRMLAQGARIPIYSADESHVYFVRGFGSAQELYVIRSDGSGEERKLMTMSPLHPLGSFYGVTKNGSIIWIRYEKGRSEIWILERP